jgi:hypothetical protein
VSTPYADGQRHAATHDARPCLACLERECGYSAYEALQFALGFFDAKRDSGDEVHVECRCPKGPKPVWDC